MKTTYAALHGAGRLHSQEKFNAVECRLVMGKTAADTTGKDTRRDGQGVETNGKSFNGLFCEQPVSRTVFRDHPSGSTAREADIEAGVCKPAHGLRSLRPSFGPCSGNGIVP